MEPSAADAVPPGDGSTTDPLYDHAVEVVRTHQRASISLVQRHLRIGYNRVARLLEAMEIAGVVTAQASNGSRQVLPASPSSQPVAPYSLSP
ncbi:DNA translocase FtsK [Janthinobacterium sp.]|uniref:DNA translocase FtsK n=1 Tax=Janthinobacterium sp. TaxID=1871054 RepID=UPI0025C6FF1E|nr:DNA translocase FtsK [Janthinobacterium sp.]